MPRSISRVILLCGVAAVAGGCQRGPTWNLVPIEGTVTKGGSPLRDMEVVFLPDPDAGTVGLRATGRTDEAGHYRLRTDNGDDGAVAGKHRVLIRDLKAAEKQLVRSFRGKESKKAVRLPPEIAQRLQDELKTAADVSRVPSHYASINETPLRADVHPGPQTFNFNIP